MVAYAMSSGMPTLFIVFFGPHIQETWPAASSLSSFAYLRFGTRARGMVVGISMLNMCVGLLAELTTIGALFRDFVGGGALPMILISSFLATLYTTYGGLRVSIVTDQLQALFSILLIAAVTVYTATTFRQTLPSDFGPMGAQVVAFQCLLLNVLETCPLTDWNTFTAGPWQPLRTLSPLCNARVPLGIHCLF